MVRIKLTTLLVFLLAMTLLPACASGETPAPQEADEEVAMMDMKIGIGPFTSFAPLFIAKEEGFFEDEGLNVEFVDLRRSIDMIPALYQGDVDAAGIIITSSVLSLIEQGESIRFVADRGYADPDGCTYEALVANNDHADSTAVDMEGSRILTDQSTFHEFFVSEVLNSADLGLEDVTIESAPQPSIPDLLGTGQADYAAVSEPWGTRIVQGEQGQILFAVEDVMPETQFLYYIFGPTILNDNHEMGVRFMRAYLRAKEQYEEGKTDRNVEIIAQYTELEPDLVRDVCWVPLRDDLRVDIDSVLRYQEWSISQGYNDTALEPADFADNSFVEEAQASR